MSHDPLEIHAICCTAHRAKEAQALIDLIHSMGKYHARSMRRLVWVDMSEEHGNREGALLCGGVAIVWMAVIVAHWACGWAAFAFHAFAMVRCFMWVAVAPKTLIWRPRRRPMLSRPPGPGTHRVGTYR